MRERLLFTFDRCAPSLPIANILLQSSSASIQSLTGCRRDKNILSVVVRRSDSFHSAREEAEEIEIVGFFCQRRSFLPYYGLQTVFNQICLSVIGSNRVTHPGKVVDGKVEFLERTVKPGRRR